MKNYFYMIFLLYIDNKFDKRNHLNVISRTVLTLTAGLTQQLGRNIKMMPNGAICFDLNAHG